MQLFTGDAGHANDVGAGLVRTHRRNKSPKGLRVLNTCLPSSVEWALQPCKSS